MPEFLETYLVPLTIVGILLGAVLLRIVLIHAVRKLVNNIVSGAKRSQNVTDTQALTTSPLMTARVVQRTRTLGTAANNLISITIGVLALVLVMGQLGFNPGALVAWAGVLGAGLAFGAQNIVKDVLQGLFMIAEDQLGVGDDIEIGDVSGRVEAVGIRITQVRDVHGTLWFIRNGEIVKVGNRSHAWARSILDLTFAADTDLDAAREVVERSAHDACQEPAIAVTLIDEPTVWGVERLTDGAATLRLVTTTRSGGQWELNRLLRRKLIADCATAGIALNAITAAQAPFSGMDAPRKGSNA